MNPANDGLEVSCTMDANRHATVFIQSRTGKLSEVEAIQQVVLMVIHTTEAFAQRTGGVIAFHRFIRTVGRTLQECDDYIRVEDDKPRQ